MVADDSGLVVHALGGRPGVFSRRYAGPGGHLRGQLPAPAGGDGGRRGPRRGLRLRARRAWRRATACWWRCGVCSGTIAPALRGSGGLRLRPACSCPRAETRSMAEMIRRRRRRRSPIGAGRPGGWPRCSGPVDLSPRGAPGAGHRRRRPHRAPALAGAGRHGPGRGRPLPLLEGAGGADRGRLPGARRARRRSWPATWPRPRDAGASWPRPRPPWGAWTCSCARPPTSSRPPSRRPPRSRSTRRSRST